MYSSISSDFGQISLWMPTKWSEIVANHPRTIGKFSIGPKRTAWHRLSRKCRFDSESLSLSKQKAPSGSPCGVSSVIKWYQWLSFGISYISCSPVVCFFFNGPVCVWNVCSHIQNEVNDLVQMQIDGHTISPCNPT
jgi:hypothetical protein